MRYDNKFPQYLAESLEDSREILRKYEERNRMLAEAISKIPGTAFVPLSFSETGGHGGKVEVNGRDYQIRYLSGHNVRIFDRNSKNLGLAKNMKLDDGILWAYFKILEDSDQGWFEKKFRGTRYYALPKKDLRIVSDDPTSPSAAHLGCSEKEMKELYPLVWI